MMKTYQTKKDIARSAGVSTRTINRMLKQRGLVELTNAGKSVIPTPGAYAEEWCSSANKWNAEKIRQMIDSASAVTPAASPLSPVMLARALKKLVEVKKLVEEFGPGTVRLFVDLFAEIGDD